MARELWTYHIVYAPGGTVVRLEMVVSATRWRAHDPLTWNEEEGCWRLFVPDFQCVDIEEALPAHVTTCPRLFVHTVIYLNNAVALRTTPSPPLAFWVGKRVVKKKKRVESMRMLESDADSPCW